MKYGQKNKNASPWKTVYLEQLVKKTVHMLRFIGTYGDCHVFFPWKTGYLEHFHGIMPKDKKDNPAQLRRRRRRETFDCIVKHNYFCLCVWLLKLSAYKCSWCPLDFWPHVFGLLL